MDRRGFILAALALGGCATVGQPPGALLGPLAELEPLYGLRAGRDGLTIRVKSAGCTGKVDFAFYVERRGRAVTVAFGRRQLETCKAAATRPVELAFSWEDLGLSPRTPVVLLNPMAAPGGS